MPKDLVCGMEVDEKGTVKTEYEGETYHFCSQSCKQTFEESPEKFIKK